MPWGELWGNEREIWGSSTLGIAVNATVLGDRAFDCTLLAVEILFRAAGDVRRQACAVVNEGPTDPSIN
jgi:hypothetical protein